ncbi:topoisomerase DNA-binding C4 zinc finger domain-containing protein [endosymbiont of unidentified scaly snail isolate Monju]|uniref:topoisomerase DNA-binding C4 zinc finger domain-containing protein n=1 Tax=endosymbiont of unidentified scaly snail isolate Monju TaxID=1248727 RepID=UPI0009DE1FBF
MRAARDTIARSWHSNAPQTAPKCGEAMVKRVARKGPYAGREFWGCSRYPKCRGVRAVK